MLDISSPIPHREPVNPVTRADISSQTQPADRPQPVSGDFREMTPKLSSAIDAVLLAHHTHRHALADGHLPLDATLGEAVTRYGAGSPVLGLWMMCKAVEGLKREWGG